MNDAELPASPHVLAFPTRQAAEAAYRDLIESGVDPKSVSLFVNATRPVPSGAEETDGAADAIDAGGATGAAVTAAAGGMGGALAGLGLLAIPSIGPLLAVGPVAGAITGALTGGALGGFAGSLAGLGISEVAAALAEKHIAEGRALVLVDRSPHNAIVARLVKDGGALVEEM